jgi:hypothetical protein
MIECCAYCSPDTAGRHSWDCPNHPDNDYELEWQRQSWIRRDNENTAMFDPENPTEAPKIRENTK